MQLACRLNADCPVEWEADGGRYSKLIEAADHPAHASHLASMQREMAVCDSGRRFGSRRNEARQAGKQASALLSEHNSRSEACSHGAAGVKSCCDSGRKA